MFHARTVKRIMLVASVVLAALSVALIGYAVMAGADVPVPRPNDFVADYAAKPIEGKEKLKVSESEFDDVWQTRLRRPLRDTPARPRPPEKPKAVVSRPAPDIKLLTTFIETSSENNRAVISLPSQKQPRLVAVGQSLDMVPGVPVVEAIKANQLQLRYGDDVIRIALPIDTTQRYSGL